MRHLRCRHDSHLRPEENRAYRYYVCVKAHQRGWAQCETRCVSAPALESAVLEQIRGITGNPTVLGKVLDQIEGHRQQDAAAATKERPLLRAS